MNSLRTDDILGAKPRVRHMPKNLIREKKIPSYFLTNLQPTNPEYDYHMENQGYHENQISPKHTENYHNLLPAELIDRQNNDPNGIPFYSRNHLSKEPRYVNYDFVQDLNKSQRHQPETHQNAQNPDMIRASSQNRYKPLQRPIDRNEHNNSRHNESVDSHASQNQRYREQIKDSSRVVQSRKSFDNRQNERKSIFRGLGFNIISNHKYEYTFQHKAPANN